MQLKITCTYVLLHIQSTKASELALNKHLNVGRTDCVSSEQ